MLASEGFIETEDGVRLFFQKLGSGPHTVMITNAIHMFDSFGSLAEGRTLIFFDLRNRGRSESVSDGSKLARGIHHDVDDLETVREHFGCERIDLIGHSYQGLAVILYAMKYPARVNRAVLIGSIQAHAGTQYPAHLTGADAILSNFLTEIARLQNEKASEDPKAAAKKFWDLLRVLMVADPADAAKIRWTPFDSPNELKFMKHWIENLLPSIQRLHLAPEDLLKIDTPVLAIHGTRDRQSPYGAGREWALTLPNARLVTVPNAAHVPWIEAPETVFGSIETFLQGSWPEAAQEVEVLDPQDRLAK